MIKVDTSSEQGKIVLTAVAPSYSLWASNNGINTGTAADDSDGDGVPNGVEYVLCGGSNYDDNEKLPQLSISNGDMLYSFVLNQASIDGSTGVQIDVGTNLVSWPWIYEVGIEPVTYYPNDVVLYISKDTPSAGKSTVTLKVPRSKLPAKLFARIRVTTN
jgi:hypothetical protein